MLAPLHTLALYDWKPVEGGVELTTRESLILEPAELPGLQFGNCLGIRFEDVATGVARYAVIHDRTTTPVAVLKLPHELDLRAGDRLAYRSWTLVLDFTASADGEQPPPPLLGEVEHGHRIADPIWTSGGTRIRT